jgi:hypothetical protein
VGVIFFGDAAMFATILLSLVNCTADTPAEWLDLFPHLENFTRKFEPVVVAKGDKPEVYSQAARYDWNGGRFEIITFTIARDPAFKEKYAADTVKGKPMPEALELNKKLAYLSSSDGAKGRDLVNKRLVVVLADDKILILEQRGAGLDLAEVAKKLDFDKVAKALASPPPAAKKE